MLKIKKNIFFLFITFISAITADAQMWSSETLEDVVDPELQRTFIIIDSEHDYDLNPHTASYNSEAQVLSGLYEGLFSYHPVTLEPVNAICSSYKVSRDKKRWTFTLKQDVKFSNGDPITAYTFKDSWQSLLSNPNAGFASLLDCIQGAQAFRKGEITFDKVGINARDETTLVVTLQTPAEHLPKILCHHAFSAVSSKDNVYSGPFVLKSYDKTTLEMVKNTQYRDAENVHLPGIKIIQSSDYDENTALYNNGEADWITGGASISKILNASSIHIAAEFGTQYLFFKTKNKPWNNRKFREALLEAIPYDELRANYYVPAETFVYPLSGYPDVNGINDYDTDYAKDLMKEARMEEGIPLDEKLTITFAIVDVEYLKKWALLLKNAWEPLGVELKVETTSADSYNAAIPYWKADLYEYSWIGDFADPLAFLELFRSKSSLNVAEYNNEEFDSLLAKSAVADSTSEHDKILAQAEQILLDDCMVIPVSHPVSLHFIDTEAVGGWQTNALDLHPLKYLYLKKKLINIPNLVMLEHPQCSAL